MSVNLCSELLRDMKERVGERAMEKSRPIPAVSDRASVSSAVVRNLQRPIGRKMTALSEKHNAIYHRDKLWPSPVPHRGRALKKASERE